MKSLQIAHGIVGVSTMTNIGALNYNVHVNLMCSLGIAQAVTMCRAGLS